MICQVGIDSMIYCEIESVIFQIDSLVYESMICYENDSMIDLDLMIDRENLKNVNPP